MTASVVGRRETTPRTPEHSVIERALDIAAAAQRVGGGHGYPGSARFVTEVSYLTGASAGRTASGTRGRQERKSTVDTSLWPDPAQVSSVEEFVRALECVKRSTGLSYEALAKRSQDTGYPLSKSTIHNLCNPQRGKLPYSREVLEAFLVTCGAPAQVVQPWCRAWQLLLQQGKATEPRQDAGTATSPEIHEPGTGDRPARMVRHGVTVVLVAVALLTGLAVGMHLLPGLR